MIAIIDYGVGNLFSLAASLRALGAETVVTGDPAALHTAERIILPGVGAFADAAAKLHAAGLDTAVKSEAGCGQTAARASASACRCFFPAATSTAPTRGLDSFLARFVPLRQSSARG